MAVTGSILTKKTSPFKGGLRTWSNRYHFTGGLPADPTHWGTLTTNLTNTEKACLDSSGTITEVIGYGPSSDVPIYQSALSIAGTFSAGGSDRRCPLQTAALIRWSTAARSTKNHPIYLFSYFHQAWYDDTASYQEKLSSAMKTALTALASDWISGMTDGTNTYVRCSPTGHVATGSVVEEYLTHRDFPYTTSV